MYHFNFGGAESVVHIQENIPSLDDVLSNFAPSPPLPALFVCDSRTERIARRVAPDGAGFCVLEAGESAKSWRSVEKTLRSAREAGLGRDGLFVAVGGGVVTDSAGFAASVYMRGARLAFVSTTLLGMADAAVGGKTAVDLFDLKNFAGSFYPAQAVYMPTSVLQSLPAPERRSGLAEIIKTAILDGDGDDAFEGFRALEGFIRSDDAPAPPSLCELISQAVRVKGRIVEADPKETGEERALLNLGHTFAHALESSAGLGKLSHGEAVAWGLARSCELGEALGRTPAPRGARIRRLLEDLSYELAAPHPAMGSLDLFMRSLGGDKKKKAGALRFVVPAERGAEIIQLTMENIDLVKHIAAGACA
ncbi:MAG: 3-dehydroquinate synthase [Spirochaetaceae bacterium]|jgi:3-dehydroquinate synthase|nr:3-dehydroquinate synthase [Spirochaetaceae bacterium]